MSPNPPALASSVKFERFEIPVTIGPADIDRLGHVNNVVYVRWVQDAAVAHWKARATQEQQEKYLWVVVRHTIEYKRSAQKDDAILVRTWVGKASDLTFERHTEVLRERDRKVLATATTVWCPVHPETLKPVRVTADVRERFSVPETETETERS
ncbi:MAG: acyl-CoA thioesterase [Ignavibacterium sp.]|jgi:acyl-CoA thioester hydrolase